MRAATSLTPITLMLLSVLVAGCAGANDEPSSANAGAAGTANAATATMAEKTTRQQLIDPTPLLNRYPAAVATGTPVLVIADKNASSALFASA